jgi:serine/threonine-protein kinase RsbW
MNEDYLVALALPPATASVRRARRRVEEALAAFAEEPVPEATVVDAGLLVTELVANSVQHGCLAPEDHIDVTAYITGDGQLRVEVTDHGVGFEPPPRPCMPDPRVLTGRGLPLVHGLSARWGSRRDARDMTVWFELSLG